MPKYPGAALFTNIVAFASKHGRHPSAVYADYRRHPSDYRLIFAYDWWEADEQRKASEGSGKPDSDPKSRIGRLGSR